MPRQPHEQPSFPLWSLPPTRHRRSWGCVWRVCALWGEFQEAPPLLKLGAWGAVPVRAGADARSVFEGTPPPPVPAAGVPPGLCPREGFPLRFLLHFPLRFRGAGGRLGKSALTRRRLRCRRPWLCRRPSPLPLLTPSGPCCNPAFPPTSPAASGLTSALHPPGLGPAARSCLPQPPSRGPQPPPTPPHGPGAMSELEQLRQEAEQLRNQIRVRAWCGMGREVCTPPDALDRAG